MSLNNISICLVGCRGETNLGSILRLMENFNLAKLLLVEPRVEVSNLTLSYACHGEKRAKDIVYFDDFKTAIQSDNYKLILASTAKFGENRQVIPLSNLKEVIPKQSMANFKILLVFGREDIGLRNEELDYCNHNIYINTFSDYSVLNLSHAVAIFLYEFNLLFNQQSEGFLDLDLADSKAVLALENSIDKFLNGFGYYQKKERFYHKKVLSKILRAHPYSQAQIRFLHGIFRAYKNRNQGEICD